jgi:acetylornithine deacetylase
MKGIDPQGVRAAVKRRKEDILRWTEKLIRFPSENRPPEGNEGEAQEFIARECRKMGLEVDAFGPGEIPGIRRHPLWLQGRNYPENRKNVVAIWRGSGGGRSLLLSGHIDVAPREPGNWTVTGPFDPVVKDGKLYGRGSADLKGGLAAAFWALKLLQGLGFKPRGDILFESVVDEEFAGGNGTLASRLRGHNADLAILTEPTRMEVCPACLGAFLGNLTLRGRAGIPYMGRAIPNPILGAARVVELFDRWQEIWRSRNSHELFKEEGKQLNVVLWNIDSKTPGEFTQLSIPALTRVDWVVWCYPGMSEDEFYRQFNQFWEKAAGEDKRLKPFALEITRDYHYVKPWETDPADLGVGKVIEVFTDYTGKPPRVGGAPLSSDMAIYGEVGRMPTVILGPRGDNLHAPDEWVLVEDVCTLTGIFVCLAAGWCG